jgi:hypothetical protein
VEQVDGSTEKIEVTHEMANATQEFVEYVNALGGHQLCEVRVYYDKYVPFGFGTLDSANMHPGLCQVTDLKYGKGVMVDAEENEQLLCYALGIYLEWDWLYRFEEFELTIHQPRLDHVDTWSCDVEYLLTWAETVLVPGYLRTVDPKAAFKPGDWCRFCKIRATCRARTEATFRALQGEFSNLNELETPQPSELTNDELAAVRVHFPNIKAFMSAVDERLMSQLQQGRKAGELKLVNGKSARKWLGGTKEVVKALVKAGISKDEIYEPAEIRSVAQLEKAIKDGKKRLKGGDLAKLVETIPGKPTIASGDDKRKTLSLDPDDEFSVLV